MSNLTDIIEKALEWVDEGRNVAIATVVQTWKSAPCPVGSQLIVDENKVFLGSVSGGCIEGDVILTALDVIQSKISQLKKYEVSQDKAWEVGLSCGGEIEIYIEPILT